MHLYPVHTITPARFSLAYRIQDRNKNLNAQPMENTNEMFTKITDLLKTETNTDTIIGQQFKLGEFNCFPVIPVDSGFTKVGPEPLGFLLTHNDNMRFVPAKRSTAVPGKLTGVLEKLNEGIKAQSVKKERK